MKKGDKGSRTNPAATSACKTALNDDEKLTNGPNPLLPMTAQANRSRPLKRGEKKGGGQLLNSVPGSRLDSSPMTSPGPRFRTVGSVPTFYFFIELLHMIIYTGLGGRQRSQTLCRGRGWGGVGWG